MPSPSLNEACAALASAIKTGTEIRAKGYVDDQINPPEAQVYSREYDPRMVFGRGDSYGPTTYSLGVRVYVARNDARAAQKALRDLMETKGTDSVLAAIEDGSNWTGVTIHSAEVTGIGQPFAFTLPADDATLSYWAVDFDVDVIW